MESIALIVTSRRPRCPTDSELHAGAFADQPVDIANRANKASCSAIALQHRLDQLLERYGPGDFDAECAQRAARDAARFGMPPALIPGQGWVQFSHAGGKVLGVR